MVKEFKDWLFVYVELNGEDFRIKKIQGLTDSFTLEYSEYLAEVKVYLPSGSWQIIGKGDTLGENDWEGIVDVDEQFRERTMYKMYGVVYDEPEHARIFATTDIKKAAASLLRSLGMEPETTLVLKKE